MNTLSINKIIEFYIHRVTVVYCLIAFVMHSENDVSYRIMFAEFDYNTHIGIHIDAFYKKKKKQNQEILALKN